ncbi:SLBB domain-containing protein [Sphingomonas flavalba]|uniref:SLBB domain-containing protein n=1 Tax=Sphingomonas flavalba TaxID=2559804 RepID=UPI0039DFF5C7
MRTTTAWLLAAASLWATGAVAQVPAAAPAEQPAVASQEKDALKGYILGPDDVIEVDVLGQPEFKTRARIRTDGMIALPFLGEVKASGMTPISFGEMIGERLRAGGFYAKPIMNVEVVSFASRYVIVLGQIANPGLQPVDRSYRVSEVIARAGGLRETGADYVVVRRASGEELKLPFEKLAAGGPEDDPMIQAGDKLFVPQADLFYIYGQINAPGAYPLKPGMTLRKVIARGGGLTQSGSEKRIKVYHDGEELKVNLDHVIGAGDVVVVGERVF